MRVNPCRKLCHGGQAGVAVAVFDCATGLLGAQAKDLSMERCSGLNNRAVLAHRERMSPRRSKGWLASAGRVGSATESVSDTPDRLARCRTSANGSQPAIKKKRAAPLTGEVEASRSR